MPSRRVFLQRLAAGVGAVGTAGCFGDGSGANSTPADGQSNRTISVSALQRPSPPAETAVATLDGRITPDIPARIVVVFGWNGQEPRTFVFGNAFPLSVPTYSSEETPGLILLPPDTPVERRDDEHWIPDHDEDWGLWESQVLDGQELQPGEYVGQELHVWGDHRYVDRIEPGTYAFPTGVTGGYVELPDGESDEETDAESRTRRDNEGQEFTFEIDVVAGN